MEKIVIKETYRKPKPDTTKKRIFKPKKRTIEEIEIKTDDWDEIDKMVKTSGEVYQNVIKQPKQVGYYKIGKSFHVFFEVKPNMIHRFFTKIFLGWKWVDNK